MTEKITTTLGKLLFNGNILFLSLSFGLLTLAINNSTAVIQNIMSFTIFVLFILMLGLASIGFSFFGIKYEKINLIYFSAGCFVMMIFLLTVSYLQIFSTIVDNSFEIIPK